MMILSRISLSWRKTALEHKSPNKNLTLTPAEESSRQPSESFVEKDYCHVCTMFELSPRRDSMSLANFTSIMSSASNRSVSSFRIREFKGSRERLITFMPIELINRARIYVSGFKDLNKSAQFSVGRMSRIRERNNRGKWNLSCWDGIVFVRKMLLFH